jgi:hypothetical protein
MAFSDGRCLALEEAARDAAGGVGALDKIDRQREEVLPGLDALAGGDCRQHHCVAHAGHDRIRLLGDFAGLQREQVFAELDFLADQFHVAYFLCLKRAASATPVA